MSPITTPRWPGPRRCPPRNTRSWRSGGPCSPVSTVSGRTDGAQPSASAIAEARAHAEWAARESHGRLLALLAAATHDVAGAEDALGDAFERALTRWPVDGVPRDPDGWLLTVARNRQRDRWRSAAVRTSVPLDAVSLASAPAGAGPDGGVSPFRDRRLELLLVCAHPEIGAAVHAPLMLNTVLGHPAHRIGRAFAIPGATMAARLGRAKRRIADLGLPFEVPPVDELTDRLAPVLEAIYAAYTIEWPALAHERQALLLGLGEVVAEVASTSAEAHGLVALMELSSARLPARIDDDGRFVPLAEQNPGRWDADLIARAHAHLRTAHGLGRIGRFQLEAAIGAVHCARRPDAAPDWLTLRRLHEALQTISPTVAGAVALVAVVAETDGAAAALGRLDGMADVDRFQPAWVTRAHLLARLGREDASTAAFDKAIALTTDPAERAHLEARRATIRSS
ncbi:RNA polymerase subunit sigma-70 [Streptomyces sp. SID6673]|nr:RNA polymerase subunit sigma-70 [Streptomyces sp. SID11726]NEB25335.1 RNA polymerase subunit sigma-70 [Streptomyces sp. SID6673]